MKLISAFVLLAVCGTAFASNVHIAAYRIDPAPHPSQDFSLYLTFQNDVDLPVDNIRVVLSCPSFLGCVNETVSLSPHEMTEVRFPITSNAPAGVYLVNVSWEDGSYDYVYNNTSGINRYVPQEFRMQIPVEVNESTISNFTATDLAYDNGETNFTVGFDGVDLHDVRASLYSDCVAFGTPFFSFSNITGHVALTTNALVNCQSGNHEVVLTVASDELTQVIPLDLRVDKRPQAQISAYVYNSTLKEGTDYLRVNITDNGTVAEGLSVSVVGSGPMNSADVVYLGDFNGSTQAVFKIQSDQAGRFPLQVEADWNEGSESFSKTIPVEVDVKSQPDLPLVPLSVAAGAVVLAAFVVMRKRQ
jgi:hypothetical protein